MRANHWEGDLPGKKRLGLRINTWAKSIKQNALSPLELGTALPGRRETGSGRQGHVQSPTPRRQPHLHATVSSIRNMPCEM